MAEPMPENPTSVLRKRIVWVARQMKQPTIEGVHERLPGADAALVATALRIMRLYEMCGKQNLKALREWRNDRRERIKNGEVVSDPNLDDGFNSDTAQDVLDALREPIPADLLVADREAVVDDGQAPHQDGIESVERPDKRDDRQGGSAAYGVMRPGDVRDLLEGFRAQAERDRHEAIQQVRTAEREIAESKLDAEKRSAAAQLEAERHKAAAAATAQRANARLAAVIAVLVAMGAGVAIGVVWSRHGQPSTNMVAQPEGGAPVEQTHSQAPTPTPSTPPVVPIPPNEKGGKPVDEAPKADKPAEVAPHVTESKEGAGMVPPPGQSKP